MRNCTCINVSRSILHLIWRKSQTGHARVDLASQAHRVDFLLDPASTTEDARQRAWAAYVHKEPKPKSKGSHTKQQNQWVRAWDLMEGALDLKRQQRESERRRRQRDADKKAHRDDQEAQFGHLASLSETVNVSLSRLFARAFAPLTFTTPK